MQQLGDCSNRPAWAELQTVRMANTRARISVPQTFEQVLDRTTSVDPAAEGGYILVGLLDGDVQMRGGGALY